MPGPGFVIGDAARLRQVLLNLVGNALKFTDPGRVSLIVTPATGRRSASFAVRDTGIGIPAEAQARIFREFDRPTTSRRAVRRHRAGPEPSRERIVELMGGRITPESTPGEGSTFEVKAFPWRQAMIRLRPCDVPNLAGRSVMLVAPQSIEASLIRAAALERWGGQTCVVSDPDIAEATVARAHLARGPARSGAWHRTRRGAGCSGPGRSLLHAD